MARKVAADQDHAWRAAHEWRDKKTGELNIVYEGLYGAKGTALGRVTYWTNWALDHQNDPKHEVEYIRGWTEQATITWGKK